MPVKVERLPLAAMERNRFAHTLKIRLNDGTLDIFPPFI